MQQPAHKPKQDGDLPETATVIESRRRDGEIEALAATVTRYAEELTRKDTIIELLQNEKLILNAGRDRWPGALASLDWFAGSVRRAPGRWLRSFNRRRRKLRRKLLPKKSEQK